MEIDIKKMSSYIINLDSYREKWIKTYNSLEKKLGIKPKRFEAVYGKKLDPTLLNNLTDPSIYYSIKYGRSIDQQVGTIGAIGCYLSHLKLWDMLVNSNEEAFLIFEDDIDISPYLTIEKINQFINNVISKNPKWDFIFLGYTKPLPFFSKDLCDNEICKINEITFCTHSYIINRKGAIKLLKKAFPIMHQIDSYVSYMSARGDINSFRPLNSMFDQKDSLKNIIFSTSIQEGPIKSIKTIITRFDNITILSLIFIFIFLIFYFFKSKKG